MIKYTLVCDGAHSFEGWFRNSGDFDAQCGRGLVVCPVCGSQEVKKGLMAPAVSTARKKSEMSRPAPEGVGANASEGASEGSGGPGLPAAPVPAGQTHTTALVPNDVRQKELVEAIRLVRAKMIENSENVGSDFASEARKIHYGDAEERNIYGEATPTDAMDLIEEGISVLPIPDLPEDKN